MSVFLFKQTETAGVDCACGARTLGKGTGGASRARAHAGASTEPDRAGRKAGRARGFAQRPGRLATGSSRQGAAAGTAPAWGGCEEPRRAPERLWRAGGWEGRRAGGADLAASGRVLAAAPALLPPGCHRPESSDQRERMLTVILEIGLWGLVFLFFFFGGFLKFIFVFKARCLFAGRPQQFSTSGVWFGGPP